MLAADLPLHPAGHKEQFRRSIIVRRETSARPADLTDGVITSFAGWKSNRFLCRIAGSGAITCRPTR